MAGNRRDFLKLAGLTAVGAAGASSIKLSNAAMATCSSAVVRISASWGR